MEGIGILILAAGASKRMGKVKQLLPWKRTNILEHIVDEVTQISDNSCVVLGANSDQILKSLSKQIKTTINRGWKKGMGSSISHGINFFGKNNEALLIILSDQPMISKEYLISMIKKHKKNSNSIIATSYHNKPGVPAIFPRKYFDKLKNLSQDFGARKILMEESKNTILMNSKGKNVDIDTWVDYKSHYQKE